MSFAMLNAAWPLQMPAAAKAVLISLADRANDVGACHPSVADICRRTCLCERTVQNALAYLERAGALKRTFRRGSSTLFEISPGALQPPHVVHPRSSCTSAADAGEERTSCTPTPAAAAPTPAGAAPRTVTNLQLNHQLNQHNQVGDADGASPSSSADVVDLSSIGESTAASCATRKASARLSTADLVAEGVDRDVAEAWLEVRRLKRAPLTPIAWIALKREATKAGWTVTAAVRKAAERNWVSFEAKYVADAPAQPIRQGRLKTPDAHDEYGAI